MTARAPARNAHRRAPRGRTSILLEAVAPHRFALQVHSCRPTRPHAVRNALQDRLDLTELAFTVDLEDLVRFPGPRTGIADSIRATVLELVGANGRIVVQIHPGVDQAALHIYGQHTPVPQPRVLVVVPQAEGLLAAEIRRVALRAGRGLLAAGLRAVLEPQAIVREGRRLGACIVLDTTEVAVDDPRQLLAGAPLIRRQVGDQLFSRCVTELIDPRLRAGTAADRRRQARSDALDLGDLAFDHLQSGGYEHRGAVLRGLHEEAHRALLRVRDEQPVSADA